MSLQDQKVWTGDNLFDYYFKSRDVWRVWGAAFVAFAIMLGFMLWASAPAFWLMAKVMAGSTLFFGLIFSVLEASSSRKRRFRQNAFITKLERGEPVSARDATVSYYPIIKEEMQKDYTVKLRTELGVEEVYVKNLPDNRPDILK